MSNVIDKDTEMDKSRGMSRFSLAKRQIKRQKLFSALDGVSGGDFISLEKSKKTRVRKVSSIHEQVCDMGCDESDRDDEIHSHSPLKSAASTPKFMLPKKFFIDGNGVDHALIPRKLRSAMKRNRESISPPLSGSKKVSHSSSGVASHKKTRVKKFKQNVKVGGSDWSEKLNDSGSITKDEEEVVETLYALAGMFPNNDEGNVNKLDAESSDANSSALPGASGTNETASRVSEEDLKSVGQTAKVATPSFNVEGLPGETVLCNSSNKSIVQEQPDLADNRQMYSGSDCSVPKVHCNYMHFSSSKTEPINEKTLCNALKFGAFSEQSLDAGSWKEPKQQEMSHPERKLELTLMPDLAAKNPVWLDTAYVTRNSSSETSFPIDKVSKVNSAKRSWKRCAAHVYISRLIRVLQTEERGDKLSLQTNKVKQNEGPEEGVYTEAKINGVGNSSNRVMTTSSIQSSSTNKNLNDVNSIIQNNKVYQEQLHAALASRAYTLQKQSFDFLSLRADGGGMEANTGIDRSRERLEPLSQLQVPSHHSLVRHQTQMPFSTPQTHYSSSTHPNQLSRAGHQVALQLPAYQGNPTFTAPYSSPKALGRQRQQQQLQQQQQQQQKQQRLWAAQLAAQFRPVRTSTAMTQIQNWQNEKHESPMLIPCSEAVYAPSSLSLEVLDSKYGPISLHQQQFMAKTTSFLPGRLMMQNHWLPSIHEETGHRLHAGSTMPLQLLSTDRL